LVKCSFTAIWFQRLNENVFSDYLKQLYDESGCLR